MVVNIESRNKPRGSDRLVTAAVLVYMHLWVLEGAIRKWIPGSEQIMYVARDALLIGAIVMLGLGSARRARSAPMFWGATLFLGVLISVQVMLGRTSLPIAAIGLRSYFAPLLLAYVVWCYPVRSLWQRIMIIVAAYAPIQAAVTIAQVLSPARSIINKQVGSDTAYFVNDGIVRASGTYSAPSGLTLYVPLALAASLYLVYNSPKKMRWFWAFALTCIFANVSDLWLQRHDPSCGHRIPDLFPISNIKNHPRRIPERLLCYSCRSSLPFCDSILVARRHKFLPKSV